MVVAFLLGVVVGAAGILVARRTRPQLDTLTGIPTRKAANDALASLKPGDAVVMIDLDALKVTNDTQGHAAGDALLATFAGYLAAQVRAGDTVARWGGDEFVVVLRSGSRHAAAVVERIRRGSPTPFSAGVADSLASADAALLDAKRAGGSRVVAF